MLVLKLGGTNGSGKSTVAKSLLSQMTCVKDAGTIPGTCKPAGYEGFLKGKLWYIIGRYQTACGGMDTISDKNIRLNLIKDAIISSKYDVVFFEGLITGKTYGEIGVVSESYKHARWLYLFMDTPFDECVNRVLKRRMQRGVTTEFNPERTMLSTYNSVLSVRRRAVNKHVVCDIPHTKIGTDMVKHITDLVSKYYA